MLGELVTGEDGVVADHGADRLHFVLKCSIVVSIGHAGVEHSSCVR